MNLLTAENAIVTRLEAQIKSTDTSDLTAPKIQSFPQEPEIHFENINAQGEILVRLEFGDGSIPIANRESVINQDINVNWGIYIVHPQLVTHTGIYNWIEKIKDALTGWAVTEWADSTPLYMTNFSFIEESGGIWMYQMIFQHTLEESEA